MRAYGFVRPGGPENEAFLDVPEPCPRPGELLVSVRAAGVNPGDRRMREGFYGVPAGVLGREVAGTVVGLGPGTDGFALGEEVFGGCPGMLGGWAERALVTAGFAARRPPSVRAEDAAVLPVAAGTAHDGLACLDLGPGATLLVNGAGGGVGLPLVQLARAQGLRVIGTASPGKHDILRRFGAVPVAYGDGVTERLRAAAPQGIDAIFDLVGGAALRAVASLLPDRSALISVGGDKRLALELGGRPLARNRSGTVLGKLVQAVASGALDPCVTDVRPFEDAASALAAASGGHSTGKVVLTFEAQRRGC